MNTKISVFVICVEAIMYLLLCDLHDCTFKIFSGNQRSSNPCKHSLEVLRKKGVLKYSCSELKKKLPGDHSHKTIFSLMSTDIDITSGTQGCLKQA